MVAEMAWNQGVLWGLIGCAIPVAAILAPFWYKIAKLRSENELKRALAERGMSADEIERVIAARPRKGDG